MALSLAQRLALAPPDQRDAYLNSLTPEQAFALRYDPEFNLRPDQLAVVRSRARRHLLLAGRMWGKSQASSYWLATRAQQTVGEYLLVAPRFQADAVTVEIQGPSGLLSVLPPGSFQQHKSEQVVTLTNGSLIHYRGSDIQTGGTRGLNLRAAVVAEAAAIPQARFEELLLEHLMPALRIGARPQLLVVCTPKPTKWLRRWVAGDGPTGLAITRGRSEDNTAINPGVIADLRATLTARVARQELDAEILGDVEGALWSWEVIDEHRIVSDKRPDLSRIVVAIDPPASTGGDECGIVVAGKGYDGHLYVLDDRSAGGLTPEQRCRRAIQAYLDWGADSIVIEANNGGDWLPFSLRSVAEAMAADGHPTRTVPVRTVNASRGKRARAEPISALYEQGRAHHTATATELAELEEQMTTWTPESGESPDRIDALVWAATELMVKGAHPGGNGIEVY